VHFTRAPTRPIERPTRVRGIIAERNRRTGSAAELWRAGAHRGSHDHLSERTGWPKNPRALAGRLRRSQPFLRVLGIHISFGREGRAGSRVIRIRTKAESTVSTVSSVRHNDHDAGSIQPPTGPVGADHDVSHRPGHGC
jgi:hypothetical protein